MNPTTTYNTLLSVSLQRCVSSQQNISSFQKPQRAADTNYNYYYNNQLLGQISPLFLSKHNCLLPWLLQCVAVCLQ